MDETLNRAEKALADADAALAAVDAAILEARRKRAHVIELIETYSARGDTGQMGADSGRPFIGSSSRDEYGLRLGDDLRRSNISLDDLREDRQAALRKRNAAELALSNLRSATRRASKLPAIAEADRLRNDAKDRAARAERQRAEELTAEIQRAGGTVRGRLSAALGGGR